MTITPNMNLIVPGVGTTSGPEYADNINSDLAILDSHDHSLGAGAQITPSGLNINAPLPMNNQTLTSVAALTLQAQSSDAASNSVYEKGVDLYFRDGSGNVIRITQSGSVAGATGTITGLPSGTASASYSSGTFVFQSATNTAANIDGGSFVFRNSTANSKGLTLQPPNAMGANYTLTLPSIPGSQSFLTVDTSGNIAGYAAINQGITRSNLAAVGQQISTGSSGAYATGNTTFTFVTNQSVVITTTGRPVMVMMMSDSSGNQSYIGNAFDSAPNFTGAVKILRDSTEISNSRMSSRVPLGAVSFLDTPIAGTYTYTIQVSVLPASDSPIAVFYSKLVAYEL